MSQARLFDVLRAPVVSEKTTAANEKNVIVLKVAKDANVYFEFSSNEKVAIEVAASAASTARR